MAGSYLIHNELHYNGLMTDLGLIAVGLPSTSSIEEGFTSFEIDMAESKPEKAFFHSF